MVLELQGEYIYIYSQMFVGFNCFFFGGGQAIIGKTDPTVKQDDGNATGRF